MANNILGNPLILDETGLVLDRLVGIKKIVFFNPTAAGDDLIVEDKNGKIIAKMKAEADGGSQIHLVEQKFNGIVIDTIDSGECHIWIEI